MGVVFIAETDYSALLPVIDPDNSTSGASNVYFSAWTNTGCHNAQSGRDITECHWRYDIWNRIQTSVHIAHRTFKSPPWVSEWQYSHVRQQIAYPTSFVWWINIQSETIKQRATLMGFMEFLDFWWDSIVQEETQCALEICDESDNWIQTSSDSYIGIPFTLWLVWSDDVAVFRCTWISREWYCDLKAWCRGIECSCEEFDACYWNWRWRRSTGCGAPNNAYCKTLDN